MSIRRFGIFLLVFSLVFLGYYYYVQTHKPETASPAANSTAAPARTLADGSATGASTAPAGSGTVTVPPQGSTTPASTEPATSAPATTSTSPASTLGLWSQVSAPQPAVKVDLGSLDPATGYAFKVELTNQGSAVYTIKLANFFASDVDKRLFDKMGRDEAKYHAALVDEPLKYKGHYSLLNPVENNGTEYLPLQTRSIRLSMADVPPIVLDLDKVLWVAQPVQTQSDGVQSVAFSWTLMRSVGSAPAGPVLKLTKTYTVRKNDYSIGVSLEAKNLTNPATDLTITIDQMGPSGVPEDQEAQNPRLAAYAYFVPEDNRVEVMLKPKLDADKFPLGQIVDLGNTNAAKASLWAGNINRFFGSMMYLKPGLPDRLQAPEYSAKFYLMPAQETPTSRVWLTGVVVPDISLKAGQQKQIDLDLFAGPKKREMFVDDKAPGFQPLYRDLHYIGTIQMSTCFCAPDQLTLGMMWFLQMLSKVTLGNYGAAIILLVILVRLVLHPLTKKGQVSMSRMQKMAPAMAKLKEKYADDKVALNREMMKMYKEQGATPIMGCLPMILQMPIWIALWTALSASIDLRHAAFLPIWLTDLAAPDMLFVWSRTLPLIGNHFNLLPILLTIAMFLQTKLMPQMSGGAAATPDQARQQKMMMFMMPAMMLLFFYQMPSGLTLYVMTSTFAGVAEQYVIRKHIRERDEHEKLTEVQVSAPGKGARGSRGKKPKGPFWTKH